jgi:hypothetical protein
VVGPVVALTTAAAPVAAPLGFGGGQTRNDDSR